VEAAQCRIPAGAGVLSERAAPPGADHAGGETPIASGKAGLRRPQGNSMDIQRWRERARRLRDSRAARLAIRMVGGLDWRDALLRWAVALAVVWVGVLVWADWLSRFALAQLSLDYLYWLKPRIVSRELFMAAAAVPYWLIGFGSGLLFGAVPALLFRRRPLGVAFAAGLLLLLCFLPVFVDDIAEDGLRDAAGSFAGLCLPLLAGLPLLPWLAQRRRAAKASAVN
jgi:hypothetical protein